MANTTFLYPVGNVAQARGFIPGVHYGIDFSVPVGTPVHAAGMGTVSYEANEPGGYGNVITLDHAGGFQTRYAHLSQFKVAKGDSVPAGAVIGLSGGAAGAEGAGNSTGPHLHFEIRINGSPVDPKPYLAGTATGNAGVDTSTGSGNTSGGSGGLAAIGSFFSTLTTGETWIRVGYIIAALILFYFAYKLYNDEINFELPEVMK